MLQISIIGDRDHVEVNNVLIPDDGCKHVTLTITRQNDHFVYMDSEEIPKTIWAKAIEEQLAIVAKYILDGIR